MELNKAQKHNASLKKLNDKYVSQLAKDAEVLCKEGKLSSSLLFKTPESVAATPTCSTLDIQHLKKHFMPTCNWKGV